MNKISKDHAATWVIIAGIITITAISGLNVLFMTADASLQLQTSRIPLVQDNDPCRLVTCGPANIKAELIGINPKTGNTLCKCPNRPQVYNEISPRRKY